jgi:exodeoxyribonuclease VIII
VNAALQGIIPDLEEAAYHARPELSSTGARRLLESPAKFRWLQDHPEPHKEAFSLGTAVHTKVLGVGHKVIEYPPEHLTPSGNASTKAATVEWVEEQRSSGLVVISAAQAALVKGMAEAVLAHPTARELFEQAGTAEASVFATDPATDVDLRARFDYLAPVCVDLKTARDASPHGFERAVRDYRYDVQDEHYLKTLELVTGERRPFRFVVVENTAPFLVGVYKLNEQWQEIGDMWATAARKMFRLCADADLWPGYGTEIHELIPPMGLIYEHQERFENAGMMVI